MSKRVRDAGATRKAILEAAQKVFADRGFAAAAMSDIAEAAGVTKSLIHHHFKSKQTLWQQVTRAQFAAFAAEQEKSTLEPGPGVAFIAESFASYFQFLRSKPEYLRLVWWSQAEHGSSFDPELDPTVREMTDRLATLAIARIRDMQEKGELRRDLDPRLLFAAYLGLLRHWFVAKRDYALLAADDLDATYLKTITVLFLEGARPTAAAR